jgi:hypothetical protein
MKFECRLALALYDDFKTWVVQYMMRTDAWVVQYMMRTDAWVVQYGMRTVART